MAYNFLRTDRDQPFLLPPDLRDWLPQGHLAWFVLDVVDQLDLQPFYLAHRDDGHGHPAYEPKTLLGVLLYAYAIGVRSSRQIESRCCGDIAFRVLAGNQAPDHVFEQALVIAQGIREPQDKRKAGILTNLGLLERSLGELVAARDHLREALAILEGQLGPDHPDVARSLDKLGDRAPRARRAGRRPRRPPARPSHP
jgi:hypothetical protein